MEQYVTYRSVSSGATLDLALLAGRAERVYSGAKVGVDKPERSIVMAHLKHPGLHAPPVRIRAGDGHRAGDLHPVGFV